MKDIKHIAFVVQARLNSIRLPNKMLKPFAGTTLTDIILEKVLDSQCIIPNNHFYFSVYESELCNMQHKYAELQLFERSRESANAETLKEIYEWHTWLHDIGYDYVIIISGCQPFLKIETINNFVKLFVESNKEGMFGVVPKKQYYWNNYSKLITPLDPKLKIMNTKFVNTTFEAAHCLYASRLDLIDSGYFMSKKEDMSDIELYLISEYEAFDIDCGWQFVMAEKLYMK